jgi:hypothetical protein
MEMSRREKSICVRERQRAFGYQRRETERKTTKKRREESRERERERERESAQSEAPSIDAIRFDSIENLF